MIALTCFKPRRDASTNWPPLGLSLPAPHPARCAVVPRKKVSIYRPPVP